MLNAFFRTPPLSSCQSGRVKVSTLTVLSISSPCHTHLGKSFMLHSQGILSDLNYPTFYLAPIFALQYDAQLLLAPRSGRQIPLSFWSLLRL